MRHKGDAFSDEDKAELTRLWAQSDPQLSAGQIGERMGLSRNSIIGRVHRIGLPGRASPIKTDKPYRRTGGGRKQIEKDEHLPESSSVADLIEGESFSYARPNVRLTKVNGPIRAHSVRKPTSPFKACQWIEGQPSHDDSCKCGAVTVPGRPYCQAHEALAYSRRAA